MDFAQSAKYCGPRPCARFEGVTAYRSSPPETPVDLRLDGNEGAAPAIELLEVLRDLGPDVMRRYPDPRPFEQRLAGSLGVEPGRVLVTAGGDDAIDRVCRAYLEPGRELILPVPSFEMIPRYTRLAGAGLAEVPWLRGPYPTDQVLSRVGPRTSVIAVVSPNNPTGAAATARDLRRLSAGAPGALLMVDLAYAEFADEDLFPLSLELPNAVAIRSLSKAWGMAGLRVGYAVGPEQVISTLRAAGGPYAVSRPSLALAAARLHERERIDAFVARVKDERVELAEELRALGAEPLPSAANFVLARIADPAWLCSALAGLGIAVRIFPGRADLEGFVRITCPGDEAAFDRLIAALKTALAPQALLFDMDGVLADVSRSYRKTIQQTAASWGVDLSSDEIAAAKAEPGAGNDWEVTRRLIERRGVNAGLDEVTGRFEEIYQGVHGRAGLREEERLIPGVGLLESLKKLLPLGVVTGRPRADAERFCERAGISSLMGAMVCMEDAPEKPDPTPVRLACERLGVERAWMVGDMPDDVRAARAAGVLPLGVAAPGDDAGRARAVLTRAGAGRVLSSLSELEELLP